MTKYNSPVKYKELLAEASYNDMKAELAREVMDYLKEHGVSSTSNEYKAAYQRYMRCKRRRNHLMKLAKGMA